MIDYISSAGYCRAMPVGRLSNDDGLELIRSDVALQLELVTTSLIATDQSAIWSRVTIAARLQPLSWWREGRDLPERHM